MDNDEAIKWAARIERAVRQRAYDDGYEDGRLDINRETEKAFEHLGRQVVLLQNAVNENAEMVVGLRDQVDYWRNLLTAETHRLNALLALQVEQADEAVDEAHKAGWEDGYHSCAERLSEGYDA